MRYRLTVVVVSLTLLITAWPGLGRVFWRRPAGSGHAILDTTPGWRRVYQADIRINGSHGRLEVLGCDDTLADVMAKLQTAFGGQPPETEFRHHDAAGWGLIHTPDTVTRILALNPASATQTVFFALTQSQRDFQQSLKPPQTHLLDQVPAYAGSSVQAFVEDETAAARLEISTSPQRPESIRSFFESAFAQNGYRRLLATPGAGQAHAGWAVFQKGMDICCVLIQAAPQTNESTITVLHKQLRME